MYDEFLCDYQPKIQNQYSERPDTTTKKIDYTTRRPDTMTTRLPTPLSIEEKSIFQTKLRIQYSTKGQVRTHRRDRLSHGSLSSR